MKDRFANIYNELQLIFRGIKLIQKMMPTYIMFAALTAIVTSVRPYVRLYFSAQIIDNIIVRSSFDDIIKIIVTFVALDFLLSVFYQLFFSKVRVNELIFDFWEEWYLNKKSFSLPYDYLENSETRASRQKIVDNRDLGGLRFLIQKILWMFRAVLSLTIACSMLPNMLVTTVIKNEDYLLKWVNTPFATLLFVAILAISIVVIIKSNKASRIKQYILTEKLSDAQKLSHFYIDEYFDDTKSGKDIRLYSLDKLILPSIKDSFYSYLKQYRKVNNQKSKETGKEIQTMLFLDGMVFMFVGLKALSGSLTPGSLIEYSGIIKNLIHAILTIVSILGALKINNKYLVDLYQYLDKTVYDNKKSDGIFKTNEITLSDKASPEIIISDLSFCYPQSDSSTLKNINLKIKPGEKIAIVGQNGSGKTTFVKVLCGLYKPTDGTIKMNGIDSQNITSDEYENLFAVVFQDYKLFSVSFANNISCHYDFDEQKVLSALSRVGLKEKIKEMPQGINTVVYKDFDELGIEISGGESQKIAIARALYKESPILVFDEPTAALDPVAEFEIYSDLISAVKGKTTIFVSHRLSSCRFCDRILVFDKGEIVQNGRHEELLSDINGVYCKLWHAQAQHYIEQEGKNEKK